MTPISLEAWLDENLGEIAQAQEFTKEPLSDNHSLLNQQLSRSISEFSRMSYLLADVESYLIQKKAQAVLDVRKRYEDLSSPERKIMAEDSVRDITRLRDGLEATVGALKNMMIAAMNLRKVYLAERME